MKKLRHKLKIFKSGFTLAEVLITLVIIGIIAAMTIPTAIAKHRKQVVATKLKTTYSILSNMLKMAESQYGSMDSWGLESYTDFSNSEDIKSHFVNKYMLPFLAVKDYRSATLEDLGYKNNILYPDGSVARNKASSYSLITLANGTVIQIGYNSANLPSGSKYIALTFFVDIDGPGNGSNTVGKDCFYFQKYFSSSPLILAGQYNLSMTKSTSSSASTAAVVIDVDTGYITFNRPESRSEIYTQCAKGNSMAITCGALIIVDGWKVSNDYPWL